MNNDDSKGKPGQPGHDSVGTTGGAGGVGGEGGSGTEVGGKGGSGGAGGEATSGTVQRYKNTALKYLIIFGVVLVLTVPTYVHAIQANQSLRSGCELANVARAQFVGLLEDIIAVNRTRVAAPGSSQSEIEANKKAIQAYSNRRILLLATVSPRDPSNAIYRDCEKAYPEPFPFGIIDAN